VDSGSGRGSKDHGPAGGEEEDASRRTQPPRSDRQDVTAATGMTSVRGARAGVLPASWYARSAQEVARDLIGRVLVSTIDGIETAGRIVETEAYIGPHDEASHAAERIGRTERNEAMYGMPGIAYVYRIYGIHWCLNVV